MNVNLQINDDMLEILSGHYRLLCSLGKQPKNLSDFLELVITRGAVSPQRVSKRNRVDTTMIKLMQASETPTAKIWEDVLKMSMCPTCLTKQTAETLKEPSKALVENRDSCSHNEIQPE